MGDTFKGVNVHPHSRFHSDQSNCCRDMAIFQNGGYPPSCICYAHVWITHEGHLVVCVVMQNLVGINSVVSILCKF